MNTLPWTDVWTINNSEGWAITGEGAHLLKLDLPKRTIEYVCSAPINKNEIRCFSQIFFNDNKIYLIPDRHGSIEIYDVNMCNWKHIKIIDSYKSDRNRFRGVSCWKVNDQLWVFSATQKRIICLNLRDDTIIKEKEIVVTDDSDEILWDYSAVKNGNVVYLLGRKKRIMYEVDLCTNNVNKEKIEIDDDFLGAYTYDGKRFWITGQKKKVYIWAMKYGVYEVMNLPSESIIKEKDENTWPDFTYAWFSNKHIWLIPARTNNMLQIDVETKITRIIDSEDYASDVQAWMSTPVQIRFKQIYIREERYLGLYSFGNNIIVEIDGQNQALQNRDFHMIDKNFLFGEEIIYENNVINLCDFINKVSE